MNEEESSLGFDIQPPIGFTLSRQVNDQEPSVSGVVSDHFMSQIGVSISEFIIFILKNLNHTYLTTGIGSSFSMS